MAVLCSDITLVRLGIYNGSTSQISTQKKQLPIEISKMTVSDSNH